VIGRAEVAPGLDDPAVRYLDPGSVFEAATALGPVKFEILDELSRGDKAPKVYRWFEGYKNDFRNSAASWAFRPFRNGTGTSSCYE
jgi:hypothetical protein